ncbi:MAG: hypothetical protein FWC77_02345 [Defluviitaleaceae bacterium]|nr:hypothetical protein [Defluviitaleaceae bacterium]
MTGQIDAVDRSKQFMERAVKTYKIFIDACSLLYEEAERFWANIIPVLRQENSSIIIPLRVYEEVDKFASDATLCARKSPRDPQLHARAVRAKKIIIMLQSTGQVQIFGNDTDNFADNVFLTVFTQYRMKYNLMLITQDRDLADDIMNIANSRAVSTTNRIMVERINKHGFLSVHNKPEPIPQPDPRPQPGPSRKHGPTTHYTSPIPREDSIDIPGEDRFAFAKTVMPVAGSIHVSYIPTEGHGVSAERSGRRIPVQLEKQLASGGEGIIYQTDVPNVVAKIYKREKLDKSKYDKIKLMLTKTIECEGVCFPLACVYNSKNEFIGYLMKKAQGKELQKCVFIPPLLKKNFPNWKKKDPVELCITILKKIKYLHDRNVIMGDINPNNILVVSSKEVYFVDTDSYQIEGYPCPVGTINFTAPEIQRKRYDQFLRTMGNEYFAVATLLFMIMLPGKPPYSLQGGENQIDNIINMDFAYPSGERANRRAPDGMWRFCWSHLPRYLKDDFYDTFHKDGKRSAETTRFSTSDWLKKFENYLRLLTDGKMESNDEMSLDLFPTRFKKNPNVTYVKCRLCNEDVDEERTEQGYCRDCLNKGETYHCAQCSCEITYTNFQKLIRGSKRHDTCKSCNDRKYEVFRSEICPICGSVFDITYRDKDFFASKGFSLPKKCHDCRGGRAFNAPAATTKKATRSKWCFITTAVCEYLQKPDDCYELTMLRAFRDGWLVNQPKGECIIKEYYRVAPQIVNYIELSTDKNMIYGDIWQNYIEPCIKLIELTAYDACQELYTDMITKLEQKFI